MERILMNFNFGTSREVVAVGTKSPVVYEPVTYFIMGGVGR